jgi:hopanoid biosynthesis associated radical SAM protein HpnH
MSDGTRLGLPYRLRCRRMNRNLRGSKVVETGRLTSQSRQKVQAEIVGIPFIQKFHVGSYLMRQHLAGRKRFPVVLMLEPLFRCNLACAGCGKIDYPDEILNQRISVADALQAVDECGAPVVSIAGGEPLLHKELPAIVKGIVARRKFVYLCTNALLMEKRMKDYQPSPYFVWSVHLDGDKQDHDKSVCQAGTYDRAVAAIKAAKAKGFRCNINCTLFNNANPDRMANFFDTVTEMGVDGITVSPGYAYERAPDQQHFLNRGKTKQLFRDIFSRGNGGKKWAFSQSGLFLDFLAGNQEYHCTPWGNPTRTVFGWQRPCYLLGEGYTKTFKELMEETDWDLYGTGNYEKCADCMVHSGYEATAIGDTFRSPLKALKVQLQGIRTDGEMAPEIKLDRQRPAEYMFARHVEQKLTEIRETEPRKRRSTAA